MDSEEDSAEDLDEDLEEDLEEDLQKGAPSKQLELSIDRGNDQVVGDADQWP